MRVGRQLGGGQPAALHLHGGLGRIVASDTEAPNMLVNLV
jgi:hypothetical protein